MNFQYATTTATTANLIVAILVIVIITSIFLFIKNFIKTKMLIDKADASLGKIIEFNNEYNLGKDILMCQEELNYIEDIEKERLEDIMNTYKEFINSVNDISDLKHKGFGGTVATSGSNKKMIYLLKGYKEIVGYCES